MTKYETDDLASKLNEAIAAQRAPLEQAKQTAYGNMNSAVGSSQGGLNAVLAGGTQINQNLGDMRVQAGNMVEKANQMQPDVDALRGLAGKVQGMGDAMLPYADKFGGIGDQLLGAGNGYIEQAKDLFGQGRGIVMMDPSSGGLASQFINYWNSLSPDRYVSQAASDTQGSYQNAFDQSARELSRRGVSAGSGAYGALERQKNMLLATAIAAAKTKARQAGLDLQAQQLDKMVAAANTMYNMGNENARFGESLVGQALDANKAAVGVYDGAGKMYQSAGGLRSEASGILGKQADVFGKAAGVYGDIASQQRQYLALVENAYGDLANTQAKAASFFDNVASKLGSGTIAPFWNSVDNTDKAVAARGGSWGYFDRNGNPQFTKSWY